jgi:hypothetical protein
MSETNPGHTEPLSQAVAIEGALQRWPDLHEEMYVSPQAGKTRHTQPQDDEYKPREEVLRFFNARNARTQHNTMDQQRQETA